MLTVKKTEALHRLIDSWYERALDFQAVYEDETAWALQKCAGELQEVLGGDE